MSNLSDNEIFRRLRRIHTTSTKIWGFRDEYDFLSHFYPSPVVAYDKLYPTVEHAYHACMVLDEEVREKIRKASTPRQAKFLSHHFPRRPDAEIVKQRIMYLLDIRKFQDRELFEKLRATGNRRLVEGNVWHDNYWGECLCRECISTRGWNWAGKILMKVREKLGQ